MQKRGMFFNARHGLNRNGVAKDYEAEVKAEWVLKDVSFQVSVG